MNDKVTVVTPAWNCEKYIRDTIKSVQAQTYHNWEMIIADDCSTDATLEIITEMAKQDPRIKVLRMEVNSGAAVARTLAMQSGTGRYVAYLDADDIWKPQKLEKQVRFMEENGYAFSCTAFEVIDNEGKKLEKYIYMRPKLDYAGYLRNNLLQTVSIMVDTKVVDKKYLVMPNLRRGQDAATWLQILKAGYDCYGLNEILAEYRHAENSLSSNKITAIKRQWHIYRNVEKLPLPFCCYCFVRYAFLGVWKRIYWSPIKGKKRK